MNDPFDLRRFVDAQAQVYQRVVTELGRGQKQSHWMWFIFPQFAGLGFSAMVQRFAIASRDEAVAYLRHDVLGPRLLECTRLVNSVEGKTIRQILGSPDDLKYRSSMTLFAAVSPEPDSVPRSTSITAARPIPGRSNCSAASAQSTFGLARLGKIRKARFSFNHVARSSRSSVRRTLPESSRTCVLTASKLSGCL
jgi:uncharacterized protein (DUF1810 family)